MILDLAYGRSNNLTIDERERQATAHADKLSRDAQFNETITTVNQRAAESSAEAATQRSLLQRLYGAVEAIRARGQTLQALVATIWYEAYIFQYPTLQS